MVDVVEGDPFATPLVDRAPPPQALPTDRPRVLVGQTDSNLIEGDPFAPTIGGMAKQFGVGVAQGPIGVAGMPGDVVQISRPGFDWLTSKLPETNIANWLRSESAKVKPGAATGARGDLPGTYELPTSHDIQGTVENVTGPFRKPQNQAEEDAGTYGQFIGSSFINPGGPVSKVLQAVIPATTTTIAGRYSNQNPYVKVLAGLVGGVGAASLASPGSAERLLRSKFPGLTEQHITDAGQLIERANQRGVNLTWPEAISTVAGQQMGTDLQRILESHPQTRDAMQEFMAPRAGQVERAGRAEANAISPTAADPYAIGPEVGQSMQDVFKRGRDIINRISAPYYDAARNKLYSSAEWNAVRKIPNFDDVLKEVRSGENAWRVADLPDHSVGVLNAVKKEFNRKAENAAQTLHPTASVESADTYAKGAQASKEIGIAKSTEYEEALGIQETGRKILDKVTQGPIGQLAEKDLPTERAISVLFKNKPLPGSDVEIKRAIGVLADKRPQVAEQLVRLYVEHTLNNSIGALKVEGNQFAGGLFWKQLAEHPQARANLKAAFEALPNGTEKWRNMEQLLEIMQATGQRQAKGSLTAFNTLDVNQMTSKGLAELASKIASPSKWTKMASDFYENWSSGHNLDMFARVITDPRSGPVFERLRKIDPNSSAAVDMVGRLIAQVTRSTGPVRVDN